MNVYKNLEFDVVLEQISQFATSEVVANRIADIEPVADLRTAQKLLVQTGDAISVLAMRRPNLSFDDIEPIIVRAKVGAVLQPIDFIKIKNAIASLRSLKSCVENSDAESLKDITAWVNTNDGLEREINNTIENETELKDRASEKLYTLRRAIMRTNAKLKERLDGLTRQSDISKYLQDNIVTLRGGRYVVPVRSECRSNVKGLIHDVSGTGATVFVEPFAIVEANNELITLKTEEQYEIERILSELSKTVVSEATSLLQTRDVLIQCGVIFAKADFCRSIDAYAPDINTDGNIVLMAARHPLIPRDCVVPVDITLDDKRILCISGPNTGGKTVALKTVGLFALMAASGIFLPAKENSKMCIFDHIYCDIGDSQSIEQSLSTFSAHMTNISDITKKMDDRSLVLLDEVGDGTDPDEGAALAVAILKRILASGATAVVTTHFNSVKEFALGCNGIANACMQFDNVNFKPTYKLLQGVSGSSYALEIAEKLGLDDNIIADARSALSAEKISFDNVMREAENLRNQAMIYEEKCKKLSHSAEADKNEAHRLKLEYEKKLAEVKENARAAVRAQAEEYAEQAQGYIDEIKELIKNANESSLFEARKIAKKIKDGAPTEERIPATSAVPPDPSDLKSGTRVFVSGLNKEGVTVSRPRGNKVTVAIGSVKTDIPLSSLTVMEEHKPVGTDKRYGEKSVREPENREIMLLGKTVDEAVEILDRIIADIAPHSIVRIVHGKGTGALGKGIQQYLKKHGKVKSYRYGGYGEGDAGVTIAEIK